MSAIYILQIYRDTENKLAKSRANLLEQNSLEYETIRLTPHSKDFVQIIQNTKDTRDLVIYQDSYFAATNGGLLQLSAEGKLIKHFTVLDGLPESDLTCLSVFDAKLFIGTRTKGILAFDGENFTQFQFSKQDIQAISTFLNDNGRLLIGTFNGGLIEFDGKIFREIKAKNQTIKTIIFLAKDNATLFIGTFNNGLWIYENDVWKQFTNAEGLPSNRVVGVTKNGINLLIATDFGLSALENDKLRTIKILPNLSSLANHQNQIYLAQNNGEFFTFNNQIKTTRSITNVTKSTF
ncbi:MAG: hypothetical protein MUC29_05215, partial [Pyrinomonadaceae bacterium]|nr:hypothetical protein [Pyrinomonadaceae bacterium]